MTTKTVEWYFDYISPFAYLAHEQLDKLPDQIELIRKPVLFAGLLKHWGSKGPAEVIGQRRFIYRYCQWLADRLAIPFKMPAGHPFNPLPLLRLSITLDNQPEVVARLFRYIWQQGYLPDEATHWSQLLDDLGANAIGNMKKVDAKQTLRDNTEQAIAQEVFGVPTFVVDGQLFWGQDSLDFLVDYLQDSAIISTREMRRISDLPTIAQRSN